MTRVKISIIILALFTCISIFSEITLSRKCSELISSAEQVLELCSEDNSSDNAKKAALILSGRLENFRRTAFFIVRKDRLAELNRTASGIPILAERDSVCASVRLNELIRLLQEIRDGEKPLADNLL